MNLWYHAFSSVGFLTKWIFSVLILTSRRQRYAACFQEPPHPHPSVNIHPTIIFHSLIRGTSFHQGFLSPPLWISVSLSVSLYFPGGYLFLSAFYSKSNHKAFIQPKSRESGYMWSALSGEMLHQREGEEDAQMRGEERLPDLNLTDYRMDESEF